MSVGASPFFILNNGEGTFRRNKGNNDTHNRLPINPLRRTERETNPGTTTIKH